MVGVGVGIAAVAAFDLTDRGVEVIGPLPLGLPSFAFPDVRLADLPLMFGGALGIALVAVADTTVLSQSLATQRREVVDFQPGAARPRRRQPGRWPVPRLSNQRQRIPHAGRHLRGSAHATDPLVGATAIILLLLVAPGALWNLPSRFSPPS